ncbi:MAG: 4Fe-4S binding protein [Candidatus Malihini olakiniferum]
MTAEVNDECILCERCAPVCPQHAISFDFMQANISENCFGCWLCTDEFQHRLLICFFTSHLNIK